MSVNQKFGILSTGKKPPESSPAGGEAFKVPNSWNLKIFFPAAFTFDQSFMQGF
jgi:hypothetical protein